LINRQYTASGVAAATPDAVRLSGQNGDSNRCHRISDCVSAGLVPSLSAHRRCELLAEWTAELEPTGPPEGDGNLQETFFYHHFFRLPLPAGVKAGANPFAR